MDIDVLKHEIKALKVESEALEQEQQKEEEELAQIKNERLKTKMPRIALEEINQIFNRTDGVGIEHGTVLVLMEDRTQ